ncbi:MAG: gluconokinase [Casimicrobiaceae bacterium]
MIVVVMGVTGSGKTTVGQALAVSLGWAFCDADDLHPPGNVAKMAAGEALTDADRWPWLDLIVAESRDRASRGESAVVACSALKATYRDRLQRAGDVRFVYLRGSEATIAARLLRRRHRYMPAALLPSQLATLEEPEDALTVDIRLGVDEQVRVIRAGLGLSVPDSPRRAR